MANKLIFLRHLFLGWVINSPCIKELAPGSELAVPGGLSCANFMAARRWSFSFCRAFTSRFRLRISASRGSCQCKQSHCAKRIFLLLLPLFMLVTITGCYSVFGNVTNWLCKGNVFLDAELKYLFISYTVQWWYAKTFVVFINLKFLPFRNKSNWSYWCMIIKRFQHYWCIVMCI